MEKNFLLKNMRKPECASKKSFSHTGWWKHARKLGKRSVNKSERQGNKRSFTAIDKLLWCDIIILSWKSLTARKFLNRRITMQERERKRQWWLRLPLLVLCSFPMLGWCEEWKPNEQLLQNTWKEMLKITELNPDTPMPQIVFLKSSPPGVQGRCYFQDKKIENEAKNCCSKRSACSSLNHETIYHNKNNES